ncbi:SOS response-associated peptidase [Cytophagaceae bacterium ABcell3]|nr:SOS response-associated peptidase [Cytophagaceae bacterium ABcell3]
MCGRYSLVQAAEKLAERYNIRNTTGCKPRYNVAPGQSMPVVCNNDPEEIKLFTWGLIPNWSVNETTGQNLINAKGEVLFSKAPFKQIAGKQRCLIPADGYYEWKKIGKEKKPHRITLSDDSVFSFAGLWDSWENYDGKIIYTFSIVTTPANELLKELNNRMPLILKPEDESQWLDTTASPDDLGKLIQPFNGDKMSYYKSHRIVNSPDYDIPECLHVAPKLYPGETFSLFD